MKKAVIIVLGLALASIVLTGCKKENQDASQAEPSGAATESAIVYSCSMHPEVLSAGPGKCNVCGMNLEEKTAAGAPGVKYAYVCPMNDQTGLPAAPGKCDKCGMDLVKTGYVAAYICPNHPEQIGAAAGKCAVCGTEMKADTSFLETKG